MRRIIDKRKKEKFMIDDEYLNGQARLCGWQGTIAYLSLCRHASRDQESFPSIKLMAEENGVSRDTIIKGINKLSERNVIEVKKKRNKGGKWLNNLYILQDKSVWIYDQVADTDTVNQVGESVTPCRSQRKTKSATPTLRKHIEGNTFKETHIAKQSFADKKQIDQIIDVFYQSVNPTINWGNTTNRKATADLIKRFGLKGTLKMAEQICSVQGKDRYAPVVTTPYQMKEKLAQFKIYFEKERNSNNIVKI